MTIYVPGKLTFRKDYIGTDDPDAAAYIAAVEAADGEALETDVQVAIHSFVKGCKNDGIWDAIKASCILAGARTLAGALVPLVGTAPTVSGFTSSDYDRETGLAKTVNATSFDTNRSNTADPQDNQHLSVWISTFTQRGYLVSSQGTVSFNGQSNLYQSETGTNTQPKIHVAGGATKATPIASGVALNFWGASRDNSSSYVSRANSINYTLNESSAFDDASNLEIFSSRIPTVRARLAFYSIGESLDLALLDTRVTALVNAIGAAIP